MVILQKVDRIAVWPNNSTCGYILQRSENRDLTRHLCSQIPSSIINNSQKVRSNPSVHCWWTACGILIQWNPYSTTWKNKVLLRASTWWDFLVYQNNILIIIHNINKLRYKSHVSRKSEITKDKIKYQFMAKKIV
jgi:hypothetical protein